MILYFLKDFLMSLVLTFWWLLFDSIVYDHFQKRTTIFDTSCTWWHKYICTYNYTHHFTNFCLLALLTQIIYIYIRHHSTFPENSPIWPMFDLQSIRLAMTLQVHFPQVPGGLVPFSGPWAWIRCGLSAVSHEPSSAVGSAEVPWHCWSSKDFHGLTSSKMRSSWALDDVGKVWCGAQYISHHLTILWSYNTEIHIYVGIVITDILNPGTNGYD